MPARGHLPASCQPDRREENALPKPPSNDRSDRDMGNANGDAHFITPEPPIEREEVTGDRVTSIPTPPCLVPGEKCVERRAGGKVMGSERRRLRNGSNRRHATSRLL